MFSGGEDREGFTSCKSEEGKHFLSGETRPVSINSAHKTNSIIYLGGGDLFPYKGQVQVVLVQHPGGSSGVFLLSYDKTGYNYHTLHIDNIDMLQTSE